MANEIRIAPARYIGEAQANYLRYELRLSNETKRIKRALQDVCEAYEAGKRFADPADHRQLIHSFLGSADVLLRRWALKALALIGSPDDTARIVDRLRVEDDLEAQTWGTAGLLKSAGDRGLKEICAEAKLQNSKALVLASRLYAPTGWISKHADDIRVSLNDDDLTLKWAIFLAGYGRAPEELFDPRHANEVFLGELNQHDSAQISEYSVWALCEREEFGVSQLRIPLSEFGKRPENVRKWLYKLVAKAPAEAGLEPEAFSSLWRPEGSVSAREGLASSAAKLGQPFAEAVLEWYDAEADVGVRENLLASMAANPEHHAHYQEAVADAFRRAEPDSRLRSRLLAASSGATNHPLYSTLKKEDLLAKREAGPQALFVDPIFTGDMVMSNGNSLIVKGDLTAQAVAAGNMVHSANHAVQNLTSDRSADKEVLSEVLRFVERLDPQSPGRAEVEAAIVDVAAEPSAKNKRTLLSRLQGLDKGLIAATAVAAHLPKLIDAVQAWIA